MLLKLWCLFVFKPARSRAQWRSGCDRVQISLLCCFALLHVTFAGENGKIRPHTISVKSRESREMTRRKGNYWIESREIGQSACGSAGQQPVTCRCSVWGCVLNCLVPKSIPDRSSCLDTDKYHHMSFGIRDACADLERVETPSSLPSLYGVPWTPPKPGMAGTRRQMRGVLAFNPPSSESDDGVSRKLILTFLACFRSV